MTAQLLRLTIAVMLSGASLAAQARTTARVEVMVLGSMHLRQRDPAAPPVNVAGVRQAMRAFAPDAVVIEWLHPSIDPATTFNYPRLADRAALARLWGMPLARVQARTDSLRATIATLGSGVALRTTRAAARRDLARLLYLGGEEANAAYQWYRARLEGAADPDAERLVTELLGGHEAGVWGFSIAAEQDLERIVPFDYQGPLAGSDVWGEMLGAMRDTALVLVDRVVRTDTASWRAAATRYDSLRTLFESSRDPAWARRYGAAPGTRDYETAFRMFDDAARELPAESDGMTQMRYYQGAQSIATERRVQERGTGGIAFAGFGARRFEGLMARNRKMVDFIEADLAGRDVRRVLVVVGVGHKWALEEILRERGYIVRPSSELLPERTGR